jgi:carboxyl-terminal processing protease
MTAIKKGSRYLAKHIFKITAFVGLGFLGLATQLTDEFEIAKNIEIFSNIYKEVHTYYVDELEPEKVMRSGMRAMLGQLDPYTTYIAPDEVERFESGISGRYAGVGASVAILEKEALVTNVHENAPAAKAGLRVGDVLINAGGQSLQGKTIIEISQILRGEPNSKVSVEVRRGGEAKLVKLEITRAEILLPNVVMAKMLDERTAYVSLNAFTENAGKNLSQALTNLRSNNKIEQIILDLRDNGGGLLSESVNVANLFLPKGQLIVQLKGRDLERQQNYSTLNNSFDPNARLVVLINNRSASASEIVAGAIQDLDRGVIIGERSFGKGLVQSTRNLSYGAKLKITTARYYVPSGRCIQSAAYKDGQPVAIADSLRAAFKTKAGRKVLDGGGISPDINLVNSEWQQLLASLNRKQLIFDFATNYRQKQATIATAADFKLTSKDFDAFLSFLKTKNYNYQTETDKLLEEFEKKAKEEKLWDDNKTQIEKIKKTIDAEKTALLQKYRKELTQELEAEIVRRYYFERGRVEHLLATDPAVAKAMSVLNDQNEYKKLLMP